MTARGAVLCALWVAVLVVDQGCCARRNSTAETGPMLQNPRFILVRKGQTVSLQCGCRRESPLNYSTSWYRGEKDGAVINYMENDHRTTMHNNCLTITNIQKKDGGVYFCEHKIAGERKPLPCGTELLVCAACRTAGVVNAKNSMKDSIIVIQMLLIVLFIAVPITLVREMKRKRSLKIEDHTYEGLEAYQAATYEDIQNVRVLAAKTMEGEHPCIE